jgi:hypothetical protein
MGGDGAASAGLGAGFLLLIAIVGLLSLGFYFLPLVIAIVRKKSNVVAIGALNLLLGWSLIGWVVALVWSLSNDQQAVVVVQQYPGNDRP